MGSAPVHHLGTIIMKFLLLIAAIASVRAEAEANPAFTYATGYLPYAHGAPLAYAHAPLVYTAAAGCQNEAGAVVPCAHGGVVPFGVVPTAPMAIGPMATATLLTATLPMPMLAIMDTMVLAITMATTVGRRGRRLLRLMPTLLLRPTHGCCMEATTVTDLPMEDITVTDTTMRHMPTLVVAVITSVVLSPALADKKERCQQKIKIDSWNHFSFHKRPKSFSKH